MATTIPTLQQYSLTTILHNLTATYGERFGVLAHLLAGLLLSASLMINPGSFLATPALMLAMTLLLAPLFGFLLSLRVELEWLAISRFGGAIGQEKNQLMVLRALQMSGIGLIFLLVTAGSLGLHYLGGLSAVQLILICVGFLLLVRLLWVFNRLAMQMLGITSLRRFLLPSLAADLVWCGGIALFGWLFILALRQSLLADLNLMMMFF